MEELIKIKLPLRFIALATWVLSVYLASIIYGGHIPAFLQGAIIVIFPAAVSYETVLRFLTGRRLDLFLAVVLCIVVGLVGVDLWSGRRISDRQVIFAWLPTYQLCFFIIAYYSFLQLMKRGPVDVAFEMSAGKWLDRVFFMLNATLQVLVPALLLAQV